MANPQSIVPTLQIISGPFAGQLFTLERDVTIIGRNPECDVVLQPKSVSRRHAAIVRKDGGFLLRDMGSTRGTYVNGQKLTNPVMLHDGNTVQILPVNYLAESERSVVFVTASRSIAGALFSGAEVAFEIDDSRPLYHSGWSVVAHGTALEVTNESELQRLRRGPLRSWAVSSEERWVRITITDLSGRRIRDH